MRITYRFITALVIVVASVAFFSAYLHVRQERAKQQDELERRSRLLAESLQEAIEPHLRKGPSKTIERLVEKFGNRERLAGVAIYDLNAGPLAVTSHLTSVLPTAPSVVRESMEKKIDVGQFGRIDNKEMHIYSLPLGIEKGQVSGALVLFHDAAYIQAHLGSIWRRTFWRVLIQTILISLVTLLLVRWSVGGPIAQMAEWMKQLRLGTDLESSKLPREGLFAPMTREVATFAKHLQQAKMAVEEEARLRQSAEAVWTPDRLKEHVRSKLDGKPLFVVSNREPYMHIKQGRATQVIVPAGGMVTALDPVLRACGGTWIAHGAGDADWDVVDEQNRISVPPDDPLYTLRRVALTKEEEDGYYYGFSNEGIWPLCHIAHTRPIFRPEDWQAYQKANQKFAEALLEEIAQVDEPCVLVQDYHFALLPRLLKEKRPDARVALFWHIPWPNPESFGICPWQRELLYGMLGADLVGFQTQFYCNNFLDTVDRALESRIDWARFAVQKENHTTLTKPFPISVAFPSVFGDIGSQDKAKMDRAALFKELGIKIKYLGVGVERMDYTKGILERFRAIERFLEKYPSYQSEFTFVLLGAPSRTHIKRYNEFMAEVETEADRVNWKFKTKDWKPIVFLKKHHSHQEILPFYQNADVCLVTSLHDGMNLVAKEFVAAREDSGGVLILSRFAGASRELRDALLVNPYDIDQMAQAIRLALEMDSEEKANRMRRMRETLKENNIYRWAGNLITELAQIRLPQQPAAKGG
ncbi:MAG: trehalose-6-phosphate synthase [Elusimicrobia bacterium]|nr:trehalose-6-phosphate synthase [Elusimicrobiota bacterium]